MRILIQELTKYFKHDKNKGLKNFLPIFQKIFDHSKITLKNEVLFNTYNRNVLYRNNDFEIVFITWGVNSESPIHYHPEQGCILTILDGNLFEEQYNKDGVLFKYNYLKYGDIGYMDNSIGSHRIINPNDYNVYSLHIYSPPGYYDKN